MRNNDNPSTVNPLSDYIGTLQGGARSGAPAVQPTYTPAQSQDIMGYVQEKSRDVTTIGGIQDYVANYEAPKDDGSLLGNAVMRGWYSTGASMANLFNADEYTQRWEEAASEYPALYGSYQDVNDFGDAMGYILETGAENVTSLGIMALGAFAGTVAAPYIGVAAPVAAGAGAAGTNLFMQAGESKQAAQQEGLEGEFSEYIVPALANTAMDTVSFLGIAKRSGLLRTATDMVEDAATKSGLNKFIGAAKDVGMSVATEGLSEATQNFTNMMSAKIQANNDFSAEDKTQLIDSFFRGLAGGAAGHAAGGVIGLATNRKGKESLEAEERANDESNDSVTPEQESELPENNPEPEATPDPVPDVDNPEDPELGTPEDAAPEPIDPETGETPEDVKVLQAQLDNIIAEIESTATDEDTGLVVEAGGKIIRDVHSTSELGSRFYQARKPDLDLQTSQGTVRSVLKRWKHKDGTKVIATKEAIKEMPAELLKPAEQLLAYMADKYIGKMPIVLSSVQELDKKAGSAFGLARTAQFEGTTYQQLALNVPSVMQTWRDQGEAAAMQVIAHEMGHSISRNAFGHLPNKARNAIYQDYRNWVRKTLDGTIKDWLSSGRNVSFQKLIESSLDENELNGKMAVDGWRLLGGNSQMQYLLSFEEYFAEQVSRHHTAKKEHLTELKKNPEVAGFWGRMYNMYWNMKTQLANVFGKRTKEIDSRLSNFDKFMNYAAIQQRIAAIEDYKTMNTVNAQITTDALRGRESELNALKAEYAKVMPDDVMFAAAATEGDLLRDSAARMNVDTGFRNNWRSMLMAPATVAERFGTKFAQAYMKVAESFADTKRIGVAEADQAAAAWKKLPKEKADQLGKYLFELSRKSDELGRRLIPDEVDALKAKFGIDAEASAVADKVEQTFSHVRDRLFHSIFKGLTKPYFGKNDKIAQALLDNIDNPVMVNKIIKQVAERVDNEFSDLPKNLRKAVNQYKALRNKNYFPRARFGRYTLTLKERGLVDVYNDEGLPDGQTVKETVTHFETFEYEWQRDEAQKSMEREYASKVSSGEATIAGSALDDTVRSMYGMPQAVVDNLKQKIEAAGDGLTAEQQAALDNAAMELNPGVRFMQHMRKRQNTAGFSNDAIRSFASYIQNASAHLARIEHTDDMVANLQAMKDDAKNAQGNTTDLADMHAYFNNHMKYILNPENDYAGLKALGFAMFLGYNVKSAYVNFTQLPLVTMPWLAARHGNIKMGRAMLKATKDVAASLKNRGRYADPEDMRVMQKLYEDGILDDGMYQNLINLANKTQSPEFLHRATSGKSDKLMAGYDMFVNNAGIFFRVSEQANRRITALAAFRLARKDGMSFDSAFDYAKKATTETQFEYGKVNRAEIMRGALGVPFLFMNYMQAYLSLMNAAPLYAAKKAGLYNGQITKEQMQTSLYMTAALLAMGGVMGLPGAAYLEEFLNRLLKGTGVTQEDLKVTMRRYIKENITDNPGIIMNGLMSEYGLGPAHLLNLALPDDSPWAVPKTDISASIGMGNFLPGLQSDTLTDENEMLWGLTGALGGYTRNVWKAFTSTDPNEHKNIEKLLPTFAKSLSKAYRYADEGQETSRGGATFVKFDGEEAGDYSAILFQALGFSPKKLTSKYDADSEKRAISMYWSAKAQSILEELAYARQIKDGERVKLANQAIIDYNKEVMKVSYLKPFRITSKMKRSSLRSKQRVLRKRELGLPTTKKERLLYTELDELRE